RAMVELRCARPLTLRARKGSRRDALALIERFDRRAVNIANGVPADLEGRGQLPVVDAEGVLGDHKATDPLDRRQGLVDASDTLADRLAEAGMGREHGQLSRAPVGRRV